MTKMTTRAIAGFALAPAVPLYLYVALYWSNTQFWTSIADSVWPILVGSMLTYPVMLAVGIPAYVLLTSHGRLCLRHVLTISGSVGLIAGMMMHWIRACVPLGLSAGITFWLIWHRDGDEVPPF
jgi:hypothetical protein